MILWRTTIKMEEESLIASAICEKVLFRGFIDRDARAVAKPDVGYNRFFNAQRGYLGPAATLREHQGRNLASALTVRAMNSLFEQGMDSVCLYTIETNVPAITLLRKIGFEIGHNWKFIHKHF